MEDQQDRSRQDKLDQIVWLLNGLYQYTRLSPANVFKSFVLGLFSALGATIGLAVVLAILGFFIKFFGGLPVVGNYLVHAGVYLHGVNGK